MMGPQSEGGPSGEGRNYGGQIHPDDSRRYQSDRDVAMQDQQLPRPNGPFASDNRLTASPAGSASGRERDGNTEERQSGDRNRSRTRKNGSGQLRICKKCGEPLTGQFVRALGGTFHLDCFRCRVREVCCVCEPHLLTSGFSRTVDK
jgi:hypothetical protein